MKTLILYYSRGGTTRRLCERSERENEVDVVEIREKIDRGLISAMTLGLYQAMGGFGSRIDKTDINFDDYDTIILATPVWAGNPTPAVNAFLHQTNLCGREISGVLLYGYKKPVTAEKLLRRRIKLAGGICKDTICISTKELRKKNADLFAFAKAQKRLTYALNN